MLAVPQATAGERRGLSLGRTIDRWVGFRCESLCKACDIDNSSLVKATSDEFMFVVRVDLERDDAIVDVNAASAADDFVPRRRGGQMLDVDRNANTGFAGFEQRQQRVTGGVLEEPDQRRCAEDFGHTTFGKMNQVI